MREQNLPILPHQRDALEKAGKALDTIPPHAAADLVSAMQRQPELAREAADGRTQGAMRAMQLEAEIRVDPAQRADRFVNDWQRLGRLGARIEAVAESARRSDHDRIKQARADMDHATRDLRSLTAQARTADEQRQQLFQVAGGFALAGIFLWSFLPGTIARAMPDSWNWPERIATRMVGASSIWDAGARLMQAGDPQAWNALLHAADIQRDNREAIEACRKSAATSRQPVRCTVRIRAVSKAER